MLKPSLKTRKETEKHGQYLKNEKIKIKKIIKNHKLRLTFSMIENLKI